jgi:hypothetical protein
VEMADYGAIEATEEEIVTDRVLGASGSWGPDFFHERRVRSIDGRGPIRGKEIEAEAEIDDRSNDEGIRGLEKLLSVMDIGRPFEGPFGVGLPEVNTWTEPVVVVVAGLERLACKQFFSNWPLAAVVAENKRRRESMHRDLTVRLGEVAIFVHDALFDEHRARFGGISRVLATQTFDGFEKLPKVLIAHLCLLLKIHALMRERLKPQW